MSRIEKKFLELREKNKKAFIAFITAGYPNLNITEQLILEFDRIGVDIIELGVPFSDPLADGPMIQEASQAALKRRVNIKQVLELVRRVRQDKGIRAPLCLMTYYNPVFCFGEERFIRQAVSSGADGVIIPDLPPEEAGPFIRLARRSRLDTVFFLSPTSTKERIKLISAVSRGFIYYVSLTGVTGIRKELPQDLKNHLQAIKKITLKPVCVGFGISSALHVRQIYGIADGAIVGSAIIAKIKEHLQRKDLVKSVGDFVLRLKDV